MKDITIIIPSLSPDEKLLKLVKELNKLDFKDIIIVNDGSKKEFDKYFEELSLNKTCHILYHKVNKGKGAALKTAYKYIIENRPKTKAVATIDADGQHLPKDVKRCIEYMLTKEGNVVFGVRDFNEDNIPFRSRFGNKVTAFVFRVLCKMKLSDTQTGLRIIPAIYLKDMLKVEGERFEYETNILIYISKNKIPYSEVKIDTVYIENNRTSHFRPIKDSMKIYKVILKSKFKK